MLKVELFEQSLSSAFCALWLSLTVNDGTLIVEMELYMNEVESCPKKFMLVLMLAVLR